MKIYRIAGAGSLYLRGLLKSEDGDVLTPSDVQSIHLNIFEALPPFTAVTAYTNLTIPTTAILSTPVTDASGNVTRNLDVNPYDGTHPMFPSRQTSYIVELVFTDQNGRPSAHQVEVDAM